MTYRDISKGEAMRYGYARVSSEQQHLDRQIEALKAAGVDDRCIFSDKESGAKESRPELDKLIGTLREGDTLVIVSFDRLARSTSQLLSLTERFKESGVDLVSLKERIDTSTPQGKLFFTISAAFAEFERSIIKERQAEGIAVAKRKGVRFGRPPIDEEKMRAAVWAYRNTSESVADIAKNTGVNRSSLYRYLKENGIERSGVGKQ